MSSLILTPKEKLENNKTNLRKYINSLDANRIDLILRSIDLAFNLGQLDGASEAKKEVMKVITK